MEAKTLNVELTREELHLLIEYALVAVKVVDDWQKCRAITVKLIDEEKKLEEGDRR